MARQAWRHPSRHQPSEEEPAVFCGAINEVAFNEVAFNAVVFCSGILSADINLYDRPKTADSHYAPWTLEAEYPNNHELAAYLDQQSAILRLPVQNVSQYASCSQDSNIALNEALRCLLARDYAANSLHRFLASLPALLRAQGADSSHWPRLLPCGRAPAGSTSSELAFSPNGQILAGPVWDWMAAAASGIETAVASGAELCQKPATPPPFSGIDCSGSGFSGSGFSGSGFSADGRSWAFIARVSLWNRAGQQLGSFVAWAEGGDSYFQAAFRAAGRWLVRDRTALALGSGGFSP